MSFGIRLCPIECPNCGAIIAMSGLIESDPDLFVKECGRCQRLISQRYDRTTGQTIVEEVKPS